MITSQVKGLDASLHKQPAYQPVVIRSNKNSTQVTLTLIGRSPSEQSAQFPGTGGKLRSSRGTQYHYHSNHYHTPFNQSSNRPNQTPRFEYRSCPHMSSCCPCYLSAYALLMLCASHPGVLANTSSVGNTPDRK